MVGAISIKILQGDVLDGLRTLPDCSVQCCITSPPYLWLRDYSVCECKFNEEGIPDPNCKVCGGQGYLPEVAAKQVGWESLEGFIKKMVDVFQEVSRVIRDDGVIWVNFGDKYAGSGCGPTGKNGIGNQKKRQGFTDKKVGIPNGLKAKDMIGVPWRVAFALNGFAVVPFHSFSEWADELQQAREIQDWEAVRIVEGKLRYMDFFSALQKTGLYLRSDCIWNKPNPMPSDGSDKPSKNHEYIFLLSKSRNYFYDSDAVREPASESYQNDKRPANVLRQKVNKNTKYPRTGQFKKQDFTGNETYTGFNERWKNEGNHDLTHNLRTVWTITTESRGESHFATFPQKLVETCIKAGTSEYGCCPKCGTPYQRIVEASGGKIGESWHPHSDDGVTGQVGFKDDGSYKREFKGWKAGCSCNAGEPVACLVLDPFMGSGTVAVVARDLNRSSVGCELNPEYVKIIKTRLQAGSCLDTGTVEYEFQKV